MTMDVAPGQIWVPLPTTVQGAGALRVLCRYEYADPADGPTWVVERLDGACQLMRVSEKMLLALWHPADTTVKVTRWG